MDTETEKTEIVHIKPEQRYRPLLVELNESLKSLTQAYVAAVSHPQEKSQGYSYGQQSDASQILDRLKAISFQIDQLASMEISAMLNP